MHFAQRLSENAAGVEARLIQILSPGDSPVSAHGATPDRLSAAMRHAALGGGKRFRPFLVIETAALFGVPRANALDAAAAIECVHCYSLAHDDLPAMDNDEMRRGQPTVWKAYDEWTAILAGDALLTLAFEIVSAPAAHPDAATRSALVRALARAAGPAGMVGGQALDLAAEKLDGPSATAPEVERIQAMKTGALIVAACEMGAILGGASREQLEYVRAYGRALGLAFQIADDLLDSEGDAETVGKAVGKDAALGKATLVSILGLEAARARLVGAVADAEQALASFQPRASLLVEAARFVVHRKA